METWFEIVVTGSEEAVEGLLAESSPSAPRSGAVIHGRELGLEEGRFSQRLREILAAGSSHLVLATEGAALVLVTRLRRHGAATGLRVESVREVAHARLRFSAEAFSRETARAIREALLSGLPPGVTAEDVAEREDVDPAARGDELYTPEHAYTYSAGGAFSGPLAGVLEMRRRALELPFVRVERLELQTAGAPPWAGGAS